MLKNYLKVASRNLVRKKVFSAINILGLAIDLAIFMLISLYVLDELSYDQWWTMNEWLRSFAYRINISWWIFLIAGVTAIVIALATVSFQAIKAAISNPVESLRSE